MSAEELITDHLDLWASATKTKSSSGRGSKSKLELSGIKRLREFILELAVRGRLIEQDPAESPASILISEIRNHREELVNKGTLKGHTKHSDFVKSGAPYHLPDGWEWSRLGEIAEIIRGVTYKKHQVSEQPRDGNLALLRANNIQESITDDAVIYIPIEIVNNRQLIIEGDILIAMSSGSANLVGKAAQASSEVRATFGAFCGVVRPLSQKLSSYLGFFTTTPMYRQQTQASGKGIGINNLNKRALDNLFVPIPPQQEQHRIVQKVHELMALCDRLEQQTSDQIAAHDTLVDTLLGTLRQSQNATELAENWTRLAANFDTLFTTEQSIDKLKQTILQLAVMGRLVEQSDQDESVECLLKRIDEEVSSLVSLGKIKKPKATHPVEESEKLFDVPNSWQWVRLGRLSLHSEAGWSPKCQDNPRENGKWAVLKVSAVTWGQFRPNENKQLPGSLSPRKELEVKPYDFLISRANTSELVARSVVVPEGSPEKLMMSDKIIRFVFSKLVDPLYLSMFNNSQFAREYYLSVAGGTSSSMKNVSRAQIQSLAVPLPPQAEQLRIVQKVDRLMALCDELKASLNRASTTRCQLAESIVDAALQ